MMKDANESDAMAELAAAQHVLMLHALARTLKRWERIIPNNRFDVQAFIGDYSQSVNECAQDNDLLTGELLPIDVAQVDVVQAYLTMLRNLYNAQ